MLGQAVGLGVEVLEDDRIEARQVLAEELVDGERDQRQLVGRGLHVVAGGAEDEEGHDVDRGVALEPHAQRAHVVGGAAGDVEDADAVADDVEREVAAVVLGTASPSGDWMEISRMRAPARSIVIGSLDRGPARDDVGDARGQLGGRALLAQLAGHDGDVAAGEAAVAADLDPEREGLVGDGGARGEHAADAGVGRRGLGERDGVHWDLERAERGLDGFPAPLSAGRSRRPSESTTTAAGRSSAARARTSSAAPRSDRSRARGETRARCRARRGELGGIDHRGLAVDRRGRAVAEGEQAVADLAGALGELGEGAIDRLPARAVEPGEIDRSRGVGEHDHLGPDEAALDTIPTGRRTAASSPRTATRPLAPMRSADGAARRER